MMATKKTARRPRPKTAYELLERVIEHIREEPKRYYQNRWLMRRQDIIAEGMEAPPCGTIACRAGWIVLLHDGVRSGIDGEYVPARANEILGATTYGYDADTNQQTPSTCRLFGWEDNGWAGTRAHACQGIKGLRDFMKQHKAHLQARLLKDVPKRSA